MKSLFGSTAAGVIIIILAIAVVLLAVALAQTNMRLNHLSRKYCIFMKGNDGKSVEKAMASKMKALDKVDSKQAENASALKHLQKLYDRSLTKYGIVKYDAFEDVGGKMSFALAMLDKESNGFVLNAIHSRDNCYLYIKEIVKGESYIMLSDEEVEALRIAYHFGEENIQ